MRRLACLAIGLLAIIFVGQTGSASRRSRFREAFQSRRAGLAGKPLPDEPVVFDTGEGQRIRVVVVTKALEYPWSLAFLPDGSMLVTERAGRLRIIRNGVLDPKPVAGVPMRTAPANRACPARSTASWTSCCIRGSPRTTSSISTTRSRSTRSDATLALARGGGTARRLTDVRDIFVADGAAGTLADRVRPRRHALHDHLGGRANRRRIRTAMAARCCGCATTARVPPRQSVRRPARTQAGDLHARPSQLARAGGASRHRRDVAERERSQRRRRDQHPASPAPTTAGRSSATGAPIPGRGSRSVPGTTRLRAAGRRLDAVDCGVRHDVLHRRQASRSGRATCSSARCGPARFQAPATSSGFCSTRRWRSCAASRCSRAAAAHPRHPPGSRRTAVCADRRKARRGASYRT